jgi:hypothetical protein
MAAIGVAQLRIGGVMKSRIVFFPLTIGSVLAVVLILSWSAGCNNVHQVVTGVSEIRIENRTAKELSDVRIEVRSGGAMLQKKSFPPIRPGNHVTVESSGSNVVVSFLSGKLGEQRLVPPVPVNARSGQLTILYVTAEGEVLTEIRHDH